jgi:hypothetical protein
MNRGKPMRTIFLATAAFDFLLYHDGQSGDNYDSDTVEKI